MAHGAIGIAEAVLGFDEGIEGIEDEIAFDLDAGTEILLGNRNGVGLGSGGDGVGKRAVFIFPKHEYLGAVGRGNANVEQAQFVEHKAQRAWACLNGIVKIPLPYKWIATVDAVAIVGIGLGIVVFGRGIGAALGGTRGYDDGGNHGECQQGSVMK